MLIAEILRIILAVYRGRPRLILNQTELFLEAGLRKCMGRAVLKQPSQDAYLLCEVLAAIVIVTASLMKSI